MILYRFKVWPFLFKFYTIRVMTDWHRYIRNAVNRNRDYFDVDEIDTDEVMMLTFFVKSILLLLSIFCHLLLFFILSIGWNIKLCIRPSLLLVHPLQDIEMIRSLLAKSKIVNAKDVFPEETLHRAAISMNAEIIEIFVQYGFDVNYPLGENVTPLHSMLLELNKNRYRLSDCSITDIEKITKMLSSKNSHINAILSDGFTALMLASYLGLDGVAKILLERGADPSVGRCNDTNHSALSFAVENLSYSTVKAILKKGPDVNVVIRKKVVFDLLEEEFTPLIIACKNQRPRIAQLLIKYKAEVNRVTRIQSLSALFFATDCGFENLVIKLLEAGANPNIENRRGETPFQLSHVIAGYNNCFEMIIAYLKNSKDVDIDYQGGDGNTVLHYACIANDFESINQLLELGANLNIKNNQGVRPIDCIDCDFEEIKDVSVHGYSILGDLIKSIEE